MALYSPKFVTYWETFVPAPDTALELRFIKTGQSREEITKVWPSRRRVSKSMLLLEGMGVMSPVIRSIDHKESVPAAAATNLFPALFTDKRFA